MVEVSLNEAIGNFMDPAGHSSRNQILRHLNQELGDVKRKIVPLEQHPTLESVRNLFERAVKINNDIKATTEMGDSLAISHDDDQLRMEAQRAVEKIEDIAANQGITLRQAEAAPAPAEPSALRSLEEAKKAPSSGKISFSEKIASMDGTTPAREIQQMFTQAHQQQDQIRQGLKKLETENGIDWDNEQELTRIREPLLKLYGAIGKMKFLAKQKGITLTKPPLDLSSIHLTEEENKQYELICTSLNLLISGHEDKFGTLEQELKDGLKLFSQSGDYSDLFDCIQSRMDTTARDSEEYGLLLKIEVFLTNSIASNGFKGELETEEWGDCSEWNEVALQPINEELLQQLESELARGRLEMFSNFTSLDVNRSRFFYKIRDGALLDHVKLSEIYSFLENYQDIDIVRASIIEYPGKQRDLAIWREALEGEKALNPLRKQINGQLTEHSELSQLLPIDYRTYEPGEDLTISCPMQIIGDMIMIFPKGVEDSFFLRYESETGAFLSTGNRLARLSISDEMKYLKEITELIPYAKKELSTQCLTNLVSTKMALSTEYFGSFEQRHETAKVTNYHFNSERYIYTPDEFSRDPDETIIRKIDEGNSILFTILRADDQEITYNPQLGTFTSSDGEAIAFSILEEAKLYKMLQTVLTQDKRDFEVQLIEGLGEILTLENTDFPTEISLGDTLYDLDLHIDASGTASLTFFEKGEGRKNLGRVEISGEPDSNVTFFPSSPQNLRVLKSLCMQSTTELPKLIALDMRKKMEEKSHVLDCIGLLSSDFGAFTTVAHRKQEIAGRTREMFLIESVTHHTLVILGRSDASANFRIAYDEFPLELISRVLKKLEILEKGLDEVKRTVQFTQELAPGQKLDNPRHQQDARFVPNYRLRKAETGATEFGFASHEPGVPGGTFFIVEVEGVLKFYLDAQLTAPVTDAIEIRSITRQLYAASPRFYDHDHKMVINQLDLALRSNPLGSLSTYARGWTGAAPYPKIFNMQSSGVDAGGPTQDLLTKAMPIWLEAARKAPEAEKKKAFEDIGTILAKSHGNFLVPRDPAFSQIGSLSRVTRCFSLSKTEVDRELISRALTSPKNAPKTQSGNMLQRAMLYNEMMEDIDGVLSETEKQLAGNATVGAIGFVGFFADQEVADAEAEAISDMLSGTLNRPPKWEGLFEEPEFVTVAGLMEFCENPENKEAVVEYCKRQKAIVIGDLIINNETREEVEVLAKAMLKQDPNFASKVEKEDFNQKLMVRLDPKEVADAFLQLSVSNTTGDPQVQQKLSWISEWVERGEESNAAGIEGLSREETEKLLIFITGAPSLPLPSKPIKIHKSTDPNRPLIAHVCFNILDVSDDAISEELFREQVKIILQTSITFDMG